MPPIDLTINKEPTLLRSGKENITANEELNSEKVKKKKKKKKKNLEVLIVSILLDVCLKLIIDILIQFNLSYFIAILSIRIINLLM